MKFLKLFIGALLLAALSNIALAEIKLIKRQAVSLDDYDRYMGLVSDDGRHYLVVAKAERPDLETGVFFLQIEGLFDGRLSRRIVLDKRLAAPLFLPLGSQHGLLATANALAEWSAIKLNKEASKVERYGELKSMLAVTETAKIGNKYIVAGVSKDNMPTLIKMSSDLRIELELIVQSNKKGRVYSVFVQAGKVFAVVGFMDGSSELWKLSPELSILEKVKLSGAVVTGIPLRDGGFAVSYMSLPDLGVFVERFNASAQSLWKNKIFTMARTGAGTAGSLCELPDGLCLVGGSNDRLLVARIDANGQRVRLTEDTRSGLSVPSNPAGYLVGVKGNEIHVRGMARNPDASSTLFHFVETATP
ncbi:MAG: hypothetical protein Q7V00_13185 [Sulfurimicrobium sp.]|nr:hypothetical protein [Sulfurimicrobium sp.]MDP2197902.1 hypothetical protein [Sulfurimicrobium sp.]MDP3687448.1 hypothetical protein [Sulfurimicrobium sp.]